MEKGVSGDLSEWTWHDGSPLDPAQRTADMAVPPLITDWEWPEGCVPLYKVRALKKLYAKSFTSDGSPGVVYRDQQTELEVGVGQPLGFTTTSLPRSMHYPLPASPPPPAPPLPP